MDEVHKSILNSWQVNAKTWNSLIENRGIPSRDFTNKAIVEAINIHNPKFVLDVGCGEGWISRKLEDPINYTGIDGTEFLVNKAKKNNPKADFHWITYEKILHGDHPFAKQFDLIVINYAFYEKENLSPFLKALESFLLADGVILIQTVHPIFLVNKIGTYVSTWIDNAWEGLEGDFKAPHPWYCRTFQDWFAEFKAAGFRVHLEEVVGSLGEPISVIFKLQI